MFIRPLAKRPVLFGLAAGPSERNYSGPSAALPRNSRAPQLKILNSGCVAQSASSCVSQQASTSHASQTLETVEHVRHRSLATWCSMGPADSAQKRMPNDLNLKFSQRLCVSLTFVLLILFGIAAVRQPWLLLIPVLFIAAIQLLDAVAVQGHRLACTVSALAIGGSYLWVSVHLPATLALGALAAVGVWRLNADLYRFLSGSQGRAFAIAAFPMHLLHYLICGTAFCVAIAMHLIAALPPFKDERLNRSASQLPAPELECATVEL